MKLVPAVSEMQTAAAELKRSGRSVALVPTLGALHAGHRALIQKAHEQGAAVVVSIYVNPTQFGPDEDFKHYPRDLDADGRLCESEKVDIVFAPADAEMYPAGSTATWIEERTLSTRWEGERRPGHFRGVCTVVAKLFNIVQPGIAVFGQKDYQQLKVVQRMVRDLGYPIEVVPVPIVREPDGLAMSSRNQHLTPDERAQAVVLWKALNVARDLFQQGEHSVQRIQAALRRTIEFAPIARLDYAEIVNAETLEPRREVQAGDAVLLAAHVGKTRLIDNVIL